ncbi:mitochondrion protein [Mycena rebaudengoi]|nr:mitochondrion protein [Mycena rebaudengoi]KAJ7277541.1 mitochondrion protein [Mycena rebaudengoi]
MSATESPVPLSHRFLRYRLHPSPTPGSVDTEPNRGPVDTQPKLGLVSADECTVAELKDYTSLFALIEAHPDLAADHQFALTGTVSRIEDVEVLAPLPGRDVLCVGKNYTAHAVEFHESGFDSSSTVAQPDFPVLFTKRASSIVPSGAAIYTHPEVTQSVDYEGELGVIIGKYGRGVKREEAWGWVWGAVIINDVTARERQRDHKQFYIGKSLDTFCPMGPYVVPTSSLSFARLHLTTRVNGAVRQSQNTTELIFDVPTLVQTASMGISIQPGDIIATGTPVGVGMGFAPPVWLKEGDLVEVSIPPLGTLRSPVSATRAPEVVRGLD